MKNKLITSILLFAACGVCQQTKAQTAAALFKELNQSAANKKSGSLNAHLDPKFSVAGHTHEGAISYMDNLFNVFPIQAFKLAEEKQEGDQRLLFFEYTKADNSTGKSAMRTSSDYKILYIDLFDQLYGMNRHQKSVIRARLPFENLNGSIILQVKINNTGRPLRLLFDTGADGLAISQATAREIGINSNRENNASVVGGNVNIQFSDGHSVFLDTLAIKNQSIALFPNLPMGIDGLIGKVLFRRFITSVDYDKSELTLRDFGDYSYEGKGKTIPISMPQGSLVLPGQLEVKQDKVLPGSFVFDTGASYSLICFRPFVRDNRLLVNGFKPDYQGMTNSMGTMTMTYTGRTKSFSFAGLPPFQGMPYTLMVGSAANENWTPGVDGSIGIRLMNRYNFTINLLKHEIHLEPNTHHGDLQDFLLSKYIVGYSNNGQLKVLSIIPNDDRPNILEIGDEIISIAGISSAKFRQDSSNLKMTTGAKIEFLRQGTKGSSTL